MKKYLLILLLIGQPAFADNVLTAINSAFSAAQAHPAKVAAAAITGADNWTIRTDTYTSGATSGFVVTATLTAGGCSFSITEQSGPQTYRQNMPALSVFQKSVLAGLQRQYGAALNAGIAVNGITLPADPQSQAALTGLFALMQQSSGMATVILADIHGVKQSLVYAQAYADLLAYGQQLYTLRAALTNNVAAVNAATTFDTLAP